MLPGLRDGLPAADLPIPLGPLKGLINFRLTLAPRLCNPVGPGELEDAVGVLEVILELCCGITGR